MIPSRSATIIACISEPICGIDHSSIAEIMHLWEGSRKAMAVSNNFLVMMKLVLSEFIPGS
jgi:hypothetical protein